MSLKRKFNEIEQPNDKATESTTINTSPKKKKQRLSSEKLRELNNEQIEQSNQSQGAQIPPFDGLTCFGYINAKRFDEELPIFEGPLIKNGTIWERIVLPLGANNNEPFYGLRPTGCVDGIYPNGDSVRDYYQLRTPYFDCFRFRHYSRSKNADSAFGNYIAYSSDERFAVKLHGSHRDDKNGQFTAIAVWFRLLMEDESTRFVKAYHFSNASLQLKYDDDGQRQAVTSICGTIDGVKEDMQLISIGALCEKQSWMSNDTPKWLIQDVGNFAITKKYWVEMSARRDETYQRLEAYEKEANKPRY